MSRERDVSLVIRGTVWYAGVVPRDGEDDRPPHDADVTISADRAAASAPASREGASASRGGELRSGQLVGDRYRIVGLLGRGGMGEVYRADDLELGTSVALKFLPTEFVGDPVRLERLRREVRLARQVSHPNVCRVYDIGGADGRSFLTMEFIDGEDLASLLRRIGRLPEDKAVALACEVCAGLAAAHEHDLVHCDLKPANVMVDGRGRARLTDFGLAAVVHDPRDGPDALAGTPAYMAPEQLAGRGATRQSDIYALGLVLYELFTGKPAHGATTFAQLRELHRSSTPPTSPSELVRDLDPAVDQAIMRCLEPDPHERPSSALAVLAALPGRDPLRALLEAGETPSPELVAASGRRGTLSPRRALQLAAVIVAGILLSGWISRGSSLDDVLGGILAPQVLEHRAREILAAVGYRDRPGDTSWGFDLDPRALARLSGQSRDERRALLRSEEWPVLRFWYRQSAAPMSPWHTSLPGSVFGDVVTPDDPPLTDPGMALVRLGPRGRLLELRVVPGEPGGESNEGEADATRVATLLDAAGIAPADTRRVPSTRSTPMPGSARQTWSVPGPEERGGSLEVEATFAGGRPTWFRVASGGELDRGTRAAEAQDRGVDRVNGLMTFGFLVGGAFFALLNVRSGRWDRRGAARLAVAVFVLCCASVQIGAHHTFVAAAEARLAFSAVAYAASRALLTWLLYVAIEPFIRRLHPTSLVSWSRLLAGRVRDPAVGRDVLVGLAIACAVGAVVAVWMWARGWSGLTLPVEPLSQGNPLATASSLASMMRTPVVAMGLSLGFLLLFVISSALLGRARAAAPAVLWLAFVLLLLGAVRSDLESVDRLAIAVVVAAGYAVLAVRSGLLAFVIYAAAVEILGAAVVLSPDVTDWYATAGIVFGAVILLLTGFGVRTSTAGAPLLAPTPKPGDG